MKIKVVGTPSLEGAKVGFFLEGERKVYTSPAIAKLCATDIQLMRSTRIVRISGELEIWILSLLALNSLDKTDSIGHTEDEPE